MTELIFLGTATNVPDASHENTHMVLVGDTRMVLVDGPGNPYSRLLKADLDPSRLTDILVTHYHPDHASGIPSLLMAIGLVGRREPLKLFANQHCMERIRRNLDDYDWEKWHSFYVEFIVLPDRERYLFLESKDFKLYSTPVDHFVPTVGLRVETPVKTLVYSADTAPTPALDRLAEGADILIHEAGGPSAGHSSSRQAGEVAARAGVEALYMVHYPVGNYDGGKLIAQAREVFEGDVQLAGEFQTVNLA